MSSLELKKSLYVTKKMRVKVYIAINREISIHWILQ